MAFPAFGCVSRGCLGAGFRYLRSQDAPRCLALSAVHVHRTVGLSSFARPMGTLRPLYGKSTVRNSTGWTSSASVSVRRLASTSAPVSPSGNSTDKDTPVHPHLRPPRKLRQVTGTDVDADRDGDSVPAGEDEAAVANAARNKKRRRQMDVGGEKWPVISYSTAEEYRLEDIKKFLQTWQNGGGKARYRLADSFLTEELVEDAVHYKLSSRDAVKQETPQSPFAQEDGDVFIFGDGAVVFWNVKKDDAKSLLRLLRNFEVKPYLRETVEHEAEYLDFSYLINDSLGSREDAPDNGDVPAQKVAKLTSDGTILLDPRTGQVNPQKLSLIKYAYSDAIVLSVKLAIYESHLQEYVTSIENVAEDIKSAGRVALTKNQVLRKTGELFFLRHSINLGLNMLDPPDFYWDREDLEALFSHMCVYLNIGKRTKIFNEKLNHCYALVELLRDHLNNDHHVRLERMIIALICVEVLLGFMHFAGPYVGSPAVAPSLVH